MSFSTVVPQLWSGIHQYIEAGGSSSSFSVLCMQSGLNENHSELCSTQSMNIWAVQLCFPLCLCATPLLLHNSKVGINLVPLSNRACGVEGTAKQGRIINSESLNDRDLTHMQSKFIHRVNYWFIYFLVDISHSSLRARSYVHDASAQKNGDWSRWKVHLCLLAAVPSRSQCLETVCRVVNSKCEM